jgi:hypothetical protein
MGTIMLIVGIVAARTILERLFPESLEVIESSRKSPIRRPPRLAENPKSVAALDHFAFENFAAGGPLTSARVQIIRGKLSL